METSLITKAKVILISKVIFSKIIGVSKLILSSRGDQLSIKEVDLSLGGLSCVHKRFDCLETV